MSKRAKRTERVPPRDRYEQQRERNGRFWKTNILLDAVMAVVVALGRIWGR
ncbi:hypothetical protein GCM10017783_05900 [Deinococcus piscis]|uniref:Transposase n=1 Tax=Deinococcus piscis TaxID=394230 RepID=A0ABQ3JZ80_9DEIO|nr:hypothetical protein [Deinococcus piscis]GHF96812.1 hypothetical protein GCM10017783_05900 [Deinococcus piscis]